MATGTVKWLNSQKGFGFIAPDDGGSDAFVHISVVERSGLGDLREDQKVSCELVSDSKSGKMSADNLKALAQSHCRQARISGLAGNPALHPSRVADQDVREPVSRPPFLAPRLQEAAGLFVSIRPRDGHAPRRP